MTSEKNTIQNKIDNSQMYTGVESVADLFLKEFSKMDGDNKKVFVFYGPHGIGKSTLCMELFNRVEKEKKNLCFFIDFNNAANKEIEGFLLSLRNHFNQEYNAVFPSFDIAYSLYWQKINPNLSPLNENYPLREGKGPLKNIFSSAGELPGKSFVPILNGIFTTPGSRYKEWWNNRGKTELANILLLEADKILPKLLLFWAEDFKDFLKSSKKEAVIFLDSFELLDTENEPDDSYINESLIQRWMGQFNEIQFVISSEFELKWAEKNDKWSNVLQNINVDKYLKKSSSGYLKHFGIEDKNIISIIEKECNEIPYLLNLSIDIYREIKQYGKKEPVISDFKNLQKDASKKLLSVLDKSETSTLQILSYVYVWNDNLLISLINHFNTGYPENKLNDLKRFSFIKESDVKDFYTMDDNVRTVLHPELGVQNSESVYKFLFEYYNDLLKSIDYKNITDYDKKCFGSAFRYAKNIFDIYGLAKWFYNFNDRFKEAGQYRFILPFINELTKMLKEKKDDESGEYAGMLFKNAIYYKDIGRYKESEILLKQSMKISEKIFGKESKEDAECILHLADVLFCQGEFDKAEPLYLKSIVLLNPLGDKESSFSVVSLINVAILFARQGKYDKAISLFEKVLNIRNKTHGDEHPDVHRIQTNIANIEFERKNYEKAEILYRKILDSKKIYYGDNHPEVSKAMINLGNLLIELKNYEETTSLYEKAMDVFEEFYGKEHPDYAMTLNNLAYLNFITGNFDTSKKYYLLALDIYKNILGAEHPDLAILQNNIGRLYTKMKNYKEAEVFLRKSLEIKIKKFGFDNPETGNSYESLAELYESLGNIKEALFYYKKYETILIAKFPADNPETKLIQEKILNLKSR